MLNIIYRVKFSVSRQVSAIVMSSYFDEHDCAPLADGASPDGLLHFARFLVTSGNWNDEAFSAMFADRPPPPTSKSFMESLPTRVLRDDLDKECPICLKNFEQDDELTLLPCDHEFHSECVEAWLNKAANCPMCRCDKLHILLYSDPQ